MRIPDCIVLKITGDELALMRASGVIDWKRLLPTRPNIQEVVEIKFDGDTLPRPQELAYRQIAGPNRFRLLRAFESSCSDGQRRREPEKAPERSPVTTPILPPLGGRWPPLIGPAPAPVPAPRPTRPQYGPTAAIGEGTPMSEHLKNVLIFGGCVFVAIVAVELLPVGIR